MKYFLFLFSIVSRLVSQIKNFLYSRKFLMSKKAPLPVISIGNIAFGGTEKTPLVMNVISFLTEHGFKPALISRGYKGKWEKSGGILSDGKDVYGGWEDSGDEPFMVAQSTPQAGIFIGKNRLSSCQKAKHSGFDTAVLDDGFQHRRLQRDLDIVLFDPSEKIALREPVSSLKRSNILLIKKGVDISRIKRIKNLTSHTAIFEYSVVAKGYFRLGGKQGIPTGGFKGKKVLAFCGIAHPERFSSLLQQEGLNLGLFFKFPDHYPYPLSSLERIVEKYQEIKAEAMITTEKDAVKIVEYEVLKKIPLYYLKIDIKLGKEFYNEILSLPQNKA